MSDRLSKTGRRRQNQIRLLFQLQNGLCHWCHKPMIMRDPEQKLTRPLPKNFATIDHLDDRFSAERGKHPGERRRVLACKHCNEERGRIIQAMQPIEVLRERAKNHGK